MTITTNKVILNEERNVSLVTMILDNQNELKVGKRPAIVVLPGGGYAMCSDREAEVVAFPYLAAGFNAFVLRYSVGDHRRWPNPLNDWDQAMEYILDHAEAWGVAEDKIAVVGFSAGGHLAASAATLAKHRPNAALLGYAALLQDIADACHPGSVVPAPVDCVDGKTPPCFIFAARDDSLVPLSNQTRFMEKLNEFGIIYECHIYPFGGHGFSTGETHISGDTCRRLPNWVKDSIGFLEDVFGALTPKGFKKPTIAGKVNGNREEYLSINCTYHYLSDHPGTDQIIAPIRTVLEGFAKANYKNPESAISIIGSMKLGDILAFLGKSPSELTEIDSLLAKIKNLNN